MTREDKASALAAGGASSAAGGPPSHISPSQRSAGFRTRSASTSPDVAASVSYKGVSFVSPAKPVPSPATVAAANGPRDKNMMAQGDSYTIAEAAKLLNVAPSTLRYWEAEGLIQSTRRPGSNYRTYSLRSLFAASYIAFFRSMDVPVKTIAKNQNDTIEDLVAMLDATQEAVDARLRRLRLISDRLRRQRMLAQSAHDLIGKGMREITPSAKWFEAYSPGSVRQREALLRDSQRYGVLIDANNPHVMNEGCVGFPGDAPAHEDDEPFEILWDRDVELSWKVCFFEGVAFSEKGGDVNVEVDGLFDRVRRAGLTPLYALAHFLITANFDGIKDCYRVWVACSHER